MTSRSSKFNKTNGNQSLTKKKFNTFGIQYPNSTLSQKPLLKKQIVQHETVLPINFFHTPGEYNKMLIQFGWKQEIIDSPERPRGLKSLELINNPVFEKYKVQRFQRIKCYEQNKRVKTVKTANSMASKCVCCCCEDFCKDCAASNLCQKQEGIISQQRRQKPAKSQLYIESAKKQLVNTTSRKKDFEQLNPQKQDSLKRQKSKHRIQQLINNTLIKTIQQKRNNQLLKLIKNENKNIIKNFNESVRVKNRIASASQPQKKRLSKPSKEQIRKAYWQSIKELLILQLKRPKLEKPQKNHHSQSPKKTKLYFSPQKMDKLRINRGKQAYNQIVRQSQQKSQLAKMKKKKILAFNAKQAQILKNCRKSKFKPTRQMIESAFTNIL